MNETANILDEINVQEVADACEEIAKATSGKGFIAKIAGGLMVGGLTLGAIVYSKKDKLKALSNNRKIKKLEKQGFTVTAPEAPVENEDDASREDETK